RLFRISHTHCNCAVDWQLQNISESRQSRCGGAQGRGQIVEERLVRQIPNRGHIVKRERTLEDPRPTAVTIPMFPIAAKADAVCAPLPVDIVIPLIGAQDAMLRDVVVIANRQAKAADAWPAEVKAVERIAALTGIRRTQLIAEIQMSEPELID